MKQYEIWWADLPKPAGRRPVLLLSRDDAYSVLNKFIADHFKDASVEKISRISQRRVKEVKRAMGYALGWEELISVGE